MKPTFIKAFESSPVHCLKFRPSGKRRKPANGGAIEILFSLLFKQVDDQVYEALPMVNVV
jgi:hypothetical protein